MGYHKSVNVLQDGNILAEYGPMRLVISALVGKVPQREMCLKAAEVSFEYLERVANLRRILSKKLSQVPEDMEDVLGVNMVESVLAVGDEDLTPMAAVAGTIGDAVADFLVERGSTRVMVDNGGDLALRLTGGEPLTVGARTELKEKEVSHVITLEPGRASWGVATSGTGGRSFTRGVASAVTVVAGRCSFADAAATAVANASFVKDRCVIQRSAEEIDPNTDIGGLPVTVAVGPLCEDKKEMALSQAWNRAEELVRDGIIFGALEAIQGKVTMTDFFRERLVSV
jgi:ApbE superfamily uncharacterized protein (UPF0280 family)